MFAFFSTLIEYIQLIFGIVINTFTSLITFFRVLLSAVILPQSFIMYVPTFLSTSVLIVVAVSVLKLIIGRDNG